MRFSVFYISSFLEKKSKLVWSLVFIYALIIFLLSSFPYKPPEPSIFTSVPSVFKHVVEYSLFGFLLYSAFRSNDKTRHRALLFTLLSATFYGITDELHQLFVPGRTASIYDVLADSIGGFIGALAVKR